MVCVRGRAQGFGVVVAAAVPSVLYLLYVLHYSVNIPFADDWFMVPIVNASIHGHLTLNDLWGQYGDTRIFGARLAFAVVGPLVHLNERDVIVSSAAIFVASYILLLSLFRLYTHAPLTFVPVLTIGVVWFSLVDFENSLWSFQLAWYLSLFFFVVTAYLLLVPRHRRTLVFALAIVAAVCGSLSIVQGFVLWPVGLICLLWKTPWSRRTRYESVIWVLAAVITAAIYVPGYNPSEAAGACGAGRAGCSLSIGLHHPGRVGSFLLALFGDVLPAPYQNIAAHVLLGAVICIVAIFVVVQSLREPNRQANPLPLILIVFAVLFDLSIAIGRVGEGLPTAVGPNRFTMPNLVLLVGILVYACAHVPSFRRLGNSVGAREWVKVVGFGTLMAFVLAQCITSTRSGITNGNLRRDTLEIDARVVANLREIPASEQGCYVNLTVWNNAFPEDPSAGLSLLARPLGMAERDRLSLFRHGTEHHYRAEGPPDLPQCDG